jgi:hypothetical protein
VQNRGQEAGLQQGTPVMIHLPADALRVLAEGGQAPARARSEEPAEPAAAPR